MKAFGRICTLAAVAAGLFAAAGAGHAIAGGAQKEPRQEWRGTEQAGLCLVTVALEPATAEAFIDGTPMEALPGYGAPEPGRREARLAPGDHLLEARAPGYDTALATLTVREGESSALVARSLEKTRGLALLRSDPPGAEITIGGVSFGTAPKLVADLELGTWQATFSLPGYKPATVQFTLKDRTPVLAEARLATDSATLRVTANVEGAEIRVNGAVRGTAPCMVERVPAGDVTVVASAPGYRDFVLAGRAGEGETMDVQARLEPLPARLEVFSLPDGARVYLDDAYKGDTPLSLDGVAAGSHRVRVEKQGFDPMARTVALARGAEAAEEFRLKSNTGRISVTTAPDGVAVYVDGAKAGETPPGEVKDLSGVLDLDGIAAGTHTLKFAKPGYFEKSVECEVKRGETALLRIELPRRFVPDYQVVTETGPHTGVFVSIAAGAIRIETRPGVVTAYPLEKVTSHGPLK